MTKTSYAIATYTRKQRTIMEQMSGTERAITGYEKMLSIATEHGIEYEMERLPKMIDEQHGELDDLIEQAIMHGLGPEDLEAL